MNGKKFAKFSISLTLVFLILAGALQIAIDPLFQYHQPWFGLKPVVTNERYQNAGIAKTFDYENVIIGNSLAENFYVSDVDKLFGGKTVKLTAAGSHTKDWTYTLDILKDRKPNKVLINLDPYIMNTDPEELKHELPTFLYDYNYLNDVNYFINFSILNMYTFDMIKKNHTNRVPDYNKVFCWDDDIKTGKTEALKHYQRPQKGTEIIDAGELKSTAVANMKNLTEYYQSMPGTQFVFYCSPFSILFWDKTNQNSGIDAWRETYLDVIRGLMQYNNVSVYFWDDQEMLDTICNLNYYTDEAHYSSEVCRMICDRISEKRGLMQQSNYHSTVNHFFDFLKSYDYDKLFI